MSDYIPIELLNQILLKLPVKALIRFTSVCKSWQSLITSPTFISTHLSIPKNHFVLRRYDYDDDDYKREHYSLLKLTENGYSSSELEFPLKTRFPDIVGSADGLFCLTDDYSCYRPPPPIIIWNPSIKKHVVLPNATINPKEYRDFVLGFGVADHVYKVVRLVYFNDDFTVLPEAEVFSLRRNKVTRWRRVWANEVRLQACEPIRCQVFLKGFVHWLAFDKWFRKSILTFQVGDEVFGEVMLPDELSRVDTWRLCLSVIRESLVVIKENSSIDVWIMNEYGVKESWNKLYRIGSGEGFTQTFGFCRSSEALWASKEDELVAYNPETREIKNLGIQHGKIWLFYIDNYAENLVLLNCGHELDSCA